MDYNIHNFLTNPIKYFNNEKKLKKLVNLLIDLSNHNEKLMNKIQQLEYTDKMYLIKIKKEKIDNIEIKILQNFSLIKKENIRLILRN
jgi:hypothetical protein